MKYLRSFYSRYFFYLGITGLFSAIGLSLAAPKLLARSQPQPINPTPQNSVFIADSNTENSNTQIPQRWESQKYQPPFGISAPQGTEAGGTRGLDRLISLAPKVSNGNEKISFGVTTSAYPTFFVYVPPQITLSNPVAEAEDVANNVYFVEFLLVDEREREIYQAEFSISDADNRILTIALPTEAGLNPLEVDKNYKWSFAIYDSDLRIVTRQSTQGWVRRVAPSENLAQELAQASPQMKARLYARAEIWYDALAELAQLYRDNPQDLNIARDWNNLLQAAEIDNTVIQPSLLFSHAESE